MNAFTRPKMDSLKKKFTAEMIAATRYNIPLDMAYALWWADTRADSIGLHLSGTGRQIIKKTSLTCYPVNLPDAFLLTNRIIIGLNRCLVCPFYLSTRVTERSPKKYIELYGQQEATFLVLLGGDLNQFIDQMEMRIQP